MKYKKIVNFYACCEKWKPGRNSKGELLKDKACWSCYYNLFGYCWVESDSKLVALALEDVELAKQELHRRLEEVKREIRNNYRTARRIENEKIFEEVCDTLREKIALSKETIELAKKFWEKYPKKVFSERDLRFWTLACFYVSIKTTDCIPFNFKDFLRWFGFVDDFGKVLNYEGMQAKKQIRKYYWYIIRNFEVQTKICYSLPQIYIKGVAGKLELEKRMLDYALHLSNEVVRRHLHSGCDPKGIAGAILYITALEHKLPITQDEIARLFHISTHVLRSRYKEIVEELRDFCPHTYQIRQKAKERGMKAWETIQKEFLKNE